MKKIVRLIEKIEGEAELVCGYENERVSDVQIRFATSRHIETILKGKDPLDALAINPRVCGICGHAHLIATVRALESCYENVKLTQKAEKIREITLSLELLQNHFKWFYLTVMPLLELGEDVEKAAMPSRIVGEMIALAAGQYPHTSYAIPGGIVSQITPLELLGIKERLKEVQTIFSDNIIDADPSFFKDCDKVELMLDRRGDLPAAMKRILERGWERIGKSLDRFIVFGGGLFKPGKSIGTRITENLSLRYIEEEPIKNSAAMRVSYKKREFETGPLARAMLRKTPLVKEAHRRYGDSIFTRILARVCEIPQLIIYIDELLKQIEPSEESWIDPGQLPPKSSGTGVVEAARGSLVHKLEIEEGVISKYEIITPTQWNLSTGTTERPGVAQKAILGLLRNDPIDLVFKSFDVCSVCTTH